MEERTCPACNGKELRIYMIGYQEPETICLDCGRSTSPLPDNPPKKKRKLRSTINVDYILIALQFILYAIMAIIWLLYILPPALEAMSK